MFRGQINLIIKIINHDIDRTVTQNGINGWEIINK